MANTLGNYSPEFYAQEALIQLRKALGMAARVYRGVDAARETEGNSLGDVVNLKRPTTFEAKDHVEGVGSDVQDIETQNVAIKLDKHREVKYALTDRELAYTSEQIISQHITPAAYALADKIDQDLHALGDLVGPHADIYAINSTAITGPRKVLRQNEVPLVPGMIHYLVDAGVEAQLLDLGIFHEAQVTGSEDNLPSLLNGSLGRRFGVDVFATQNADIKRSGIRSGYPTGTANPDRIGFVSAEGGVQPVNSTTLNVAGFTAAQRFDKGVSFTIAGDPTTYVLTETVTTTTGEWTASIFPGLRRQPPLTNPVVTFTAHDLMSVEHYRNLMFHRDAFSLAFAPLPMTGDGRGAEMATITDVEAGISLRARMWYEGGPGKNFVALDCLYGTQVLDPMLAVRVARLTDLAPV